MQKVFLHVAGGTAGHIFPAQTIAQQNANVKHIILTDQRGMRFIKQNIFQEMIVSPIMRKALFTTMFQTISHTRKLFKQYQFDGVFCYGGYVTFLPALLSRIYNIPLYIIETNALMGKANRLLQKIANQVFITFPHTQYAKKHSIVCGFIVRNSFYNICTQKTSDTSFKILILGSSIGTTFFAQQFMQIFQFLPKSLLDTFIVIHHAPSKEHHFLQQTYQQLQIKHEVYEYIENIAQIMNEADLLICRSGASTLSEAAVLGKSMIMIPYPSSADNHQYYNALQMQQMGYGKMYEQKDFNAQMVAEYISSFAENYLNNIADKCVNVNKTEVIWEYVKV